MDSYTESALVRQIIDALLEDAENAPGGVPDDHWRQAMMHAVRVADDVMGQE